MWGVKSAILLDEGNFLGIFTLLNWKIRYCENEKNISAVTTEKTERPRLQKKKVNARRARGAGPTPVQGKTESFGHCQKEKINK